MKIRFIINPHSGHLRRRSGIPTRVRAWAAAHDVEVIETKRPGHATELAAEVASDSGQIVVAVGGDGTMNEVAKALVNLPAALALVPCGSGNGLARHLGVPLQPDDALELVADGAPRVIDSGVVNGLPFFNSMGLGFEAEIATRFAKVTRRGPGGYVLTGTRCYFGHRPERCVILHSGARLEADIFTLGVFNTDQYGNDARIAPRAKSDDGKLDLVAVPPTSLWRGCIHMWRLSTGSIERSTEIFRAQDSRFVIERAAPGWIHVDGEPRETGRELEVTVRPASLRVIAPPAPSSRTAPS